LSPRLPPTVTNRSPFLMPELQQYESHLPVLAFAA